MDFYQLLGLIAGAMIVFSTLPQVFKTLKTKNVSGLSLQMFIIIGSAQILWLIYGIHLSDLPLVATNAGSILIVFVNILLIFRYRNAKNSN